MTKSNTQNPDQNSAGTPPAEVLQASTAVVKKAPKKGKGKAVTALQVFDSDQIRTTGANLQTLEHQVKEEYRLLNNARLEGAIRALRLGVLLWVAKHSLKHGEFTPWLHSTFGEVGHRQANYYMRLTVAFVEQTQLNREALLALSQADLTSNDLEEVAAQGVEAARNWIGDNSVNELLQREGIKEKKDPHQQFNPPKETDPKLLAEAEYENSKQYWDAVITRIKLGMESGSLMKLKKVDLKHILDGTIPLTKTIRQSFKKQKKGKGAKAQ